MTLSSYISRLNYALRGIDDSAPTSGDDEYTYWLDVLNTVLQTTYRDVSKQWAFSYYETSPVEPGTVTTAGDTTLTGSGTYFTDYRAGDSVTVSGETRTIDTITSDTALTVTSAFTTSTSGLSFTHTTIIASGVQTYSLHRRFLSPASQLYVLDSNSNRHYVDIIKPQARSNVGERKAFIDGVNPPQITFTTTIDSTEDIVGGTLYVPGYFDVVEVSESTDLIPLPDPNYAVYAAAAEIAFNDITYEDKAADLNGKANDLWKKMLRDNRRGTYNSPAKSSTNAPGIRSY